MIATTMSSSIISKPTLRGPRNCHNPVAPLPLVTPALRVDSAIALLIKAAMPLAVALGSARFNALAN